MNSGLTGGSGAGYRVGPDELIRAAGVYQTNGDSLIGLQQTLAESTVAAGQVGRHFADVAPPYRAALDALGTDLAEFGNHALEVATRLRDVAGEYQDQEHVNAGRARGIGG